VEIPTMLTMELANELASCQGLSASRDLVAIQDRCKHEGLSFLTITLPLLSDALESGLESGRFTCPTNFRSHESLPRFLGGFFKRVFAPSGELLDSPCVDSIYAIRQICRFQKKLRIACTPSRERAAIRKYHQVEGELRDASRSIMVGKDDILDKVSSIIWSRVFPTLDNVDLICRHGPGATAERLSTNSRYSISYWYSRFESSFPLSDHCFHNYGEWAEEVNLASESSNKIRMVSLKDEIPVRVVFVPKTLKSPRVIAIEPSSMQYVQQSLMSFMVDRLESHRLTKFSVHFRDQTINQSLAQSASVTKNLATIDLSDASDRVSLALVNRIFSRSPILDYLQDARSLHADLPDGSNVVLSKYASMGSALCFPVEACVFYTLIQAACHSYSGVHPTARSIQKFSSEIDVYGDDIIIPVRYVDAVVGYLERYSLKVNNSKSFRNSAFRESCGGDFFNGVSVKPVYVREDFRSYPTTWTPSQVMSAVSTSDQLYEAGLWRTCQMLRDLIEVAVRRVVPRSRISAAGVGFRSCMFDTHTRYNNNLCAFEQQRIVYEPKKVVDPIPTAHGIFNRAFAVSQRQLSVLNTPWYAWHDFSHVEYVSRVKRGVFKSKRRWITIFS